MFWWKFVLNYVQNNPHTMLPPSSRRSLIPSGRFRLTNPVQDDWRHQLLLQGFIYLFYFILLPCTDPIHIIPRPRLLSPNASDLKTTTRRGRLYVRVITTSLCHGISFSPPPPPFAWKYSASLCWLRCAFYYRLLMKG